VNVINVFCKDFFIKIRRAKIEEPHQSSIVILESEKVKGLKFFLCQGNDHARPCNASQEVILNNVQLKFFVKCKEEYYRNTVVPFYDNNKENRNFQTGIDILTNFFCPVYPNYDYIKIIHNSQITECNALITDLYRIIDRLLAMNYPAINDPQSENDFFDGIISSLRERDIVQYIIPDHNPPTTHSPGYVTFDGKCTNHEIRLRKPGSIYRSCCSIHTNPNCKLLSRAR
jgi:hypothetical protein